MSSTNEFQEPWVEKVFMWTCTKIGPTFAILEHFQARFWTKQKKTHCAFCIFSHCISAETVKFAYDASVWSQKHFSFEAEIRSLGNRTSYTALEKRSIQYMKLSLFFPFQKLMIIISISNKPCMLASDKSNNFRYFREYGTWAKCHCVL